MSASIDVTLGLHEKFKNYKYSSAFREKSDADLLSYLLDSFEAIGCLVKLGIRSEHLSKNEAHYTPKIPTVVPFHHEGPATQKLKRARKSTPSSEFETISSCSGCTKVLASSTDFHSNNPNPEEEGTSPLTRSTSGSSKLATKSSNESSLKKSTQSTVGSSRPPPVAISPPIKTELVDFNEVMVSSTAGVVSATFDTTFGFTLTTPSEETEEGELKPSVLQPRKLHTNELHPSEIGALYFNKDTISTASTKHPPYKLSVSTDSTIHPPDNPSVSTASTIHPSDNPSVSTDSTIHPPDNLSVSTDSPIHPPDNPSVSTASTELPSYETVRLPTNITTANHEILPHRGESATKGKRCGPCIRDVYTSSCRDKRKKINNLSKPSTQCDRCGLVRCSKKHLHKICDTCVVELRQQ